VLGAYRIGGPEAETGVRSGVVIGEALMPGEICNFDDGLLGKAVAYGVVTD
jgi:hypothetical protein